MSSTRLLLCQLNFAAFLLLQHSCTFTLLRQHQGFTFCLRGIHGLTFSTLSLQGLLVITLYLLLWKTPLLRDNTLLYCSLCCHTLLLHLVLWHYTLLYNLPTGICTLVIRLIPRMTTTMRRTRNTASCNCCRMTASHSGCLHIF